MLVFLNICMDSRARACVSQCCSDGLLCLHFAFVSVCIDSCACACVSRCLYDIFCLRLRLRR